MFLQMVVQELCLQLRQRQSALLVLDKRLGGLEMDSKAERLNRKVVNDNLLLFKTDMEAGHGGASGRFKRFESTALEYAFVLHLAGVPL